MPQEEIIKLRVRRGKDEQRQEVVLEQGELGFTTDTKRLWVGDGITAGGVVTGNRWRGFIDGEPTAIVDNVDGDLVFNTQNKILYAWHTNSWVAVTGSALETLRITVTEEAETVIAGAKKTFRSPYTFQVLEVRAGVASASNDLIQVDVKTDGASIFDTKLHISPGEKTSKTSSIPYTLNALSHLTDDSEIVVSIASAPGSDAEGLTVSVIGVRG